ncbi:molybdopterin-guanine dinucleotide biosynthesis protein B [Natribacillus halophilus]|nr:molybdopterin-guanine dinucleotide biosynthesis protein B [Natribacillus halophilus]
MGQHCRVLQIVGYKNSGKTALMEQLIQAFSARNMRVAALKHHGHGGAPDRLEASVDSERFSQAGAMSSAIEGDGVLQLTAEQDTWSLDELLRMQAHLEPDVVLVEGWKQADYLKIALLRGREDEALLSQLSNVCCALYRGDINDEAYVQFIVRQVEDSHGYRFI